MSQKTRVSNAKPTKGHSHSAFSLTPILVADAQTVLLHDVRTARPLAAALRPKVRASGPLYRSGYLFLDRVRAARGWKQRTKEKKDESGNRKRNTSTVAQLGEDDTHEYKRLRADTPSDSMAPIYDPLAGTASSNIRLVGSLELPHPGHCGFDVPRVEQILDLIPDLQKIDNRDHRSMLTFDLY